MPPATIAGNTRAGSPAAKGIA
ncbi:hypothetical protein D038_0677A, partial [Vibrio parahaemolyticus IDH02189]